MTDASSPATMEETQARGLVAMRTAVVALSLVVATVATALLEQIVGVADASTVYMVSVVFAAAALGTWAAIGTSLVAFLIYDFLYTTPRFTFAVADPAEWLSLLLFLLVAVVVGQLTSLVRDRAEMADRRAREGVALVAISRDIAMATSFAEAAAAVTDRLRVDAEMQAVWVSLADDPARVVAAAGVIPEADGATPWTLMRSTFDGTSDWLRLHGAGGPSSPETDDQHYVVAIEGEADPVGWIHARRVAGDPKPGRGARRLLALAADQLGIALRREELLGELMAAEVARQSDMLRGAILDSVSHDLRTPIASIRALAGGLADAAADPDPAAVRETAGAIDREGARLGELVGSLLDMGRIQAGAVRPDLRPYDLADLVETTLGQHPASAAGHALSVEIPGDLAPVLADAVLFDVAFGNVLDNASRHTERGSQVRVRAAVEGAGLVLLAVDDDGPGVPQASLPHLFDRFYRVPVTLETARHGLGMGLAIARGFVEAMGGAIEATDSDLGGLSVRITLRVAPADVGG